MTEPSIENLRKASRAIYLACEESVAADISNLFTWAADQLQAKEAALKEIAAMDPKGIRADDLGRASRIAAAAR